MSNINLNNFFTEIADTLREQKGVSSKIAPNNFSNEIKSLPREDEIIIDPDKVNKKLTIKNTTGTFSGSSITDIDLSEIEELELCEGITGISNCNINVFPKLTKIVLPNTLDRIESGAIGTAIYGSNVTLTDIPDSVTYVGSYAFRNCKNVTITKLPPNITYLGENCFANGPKINVSIIPSTVTTLGDCCLNGNGAQTVEVLCNLSRVGSGFAYMGGCKKLIFRNLTQVPIGGNYMFQNMNPNIYVPDNLVEDFKVANYWSNYASKIHGLSDLEENQ